MKHFPRRIAFRILTIRSTLSPSARESPHKSRCGYNCTCTRGQKSIPAHKKTLPSCRSLHEKRAHFLSLELIARDLESSTTLYRTAMGSEAETLISLSGRLGASVTLLDGLRVSDVIFVGKCVYGALRPFGTRAIQKLGVVCTYRGACMWGAATPFGLPSPYFVRSFAGKVRPQPASRI